MGMLAETSLFLCVCCLVMLVCFLCFFFFKQKTAYEMRISDWSSDVCSSDLLRHLAINRADRRRVVILIGDDFYYRGAADRCRKSLRRPILRQSGAGIGVGVAIVDALVDRLHALQRPETRPIGR